MTHQQEKMDWGKKIVSSKSFEKIKLCQSLVVSLTWRLDQAHLAKPNLNKLAKLFRNSTFQIQIVLCFSKTTQLCRTWGISFDYFAQFDVINFQSKNEKLVCAPYQIFLNLPNCKRDFILKEILWIIIKAVNHDAN